MLEENVIITHHDIIFGNFGNSMYKNIINYCLINAKYYIYISKLRKNNDLSLFEFLRELKMDLTIKSEYAQMNGKEDDFNYKWNILLEKL